MYRSLSDDALSVEGLELFLGDGLVHLHILESPDGNVSPGVELGGTLGVDAAFLFFELVLGELHGRGSTRLLTSAWRPSRTWFLGR